jgi:hypothetical protein
MSCAEEP